MWCSKNPQRTKSERIFAEPEAARSRRRSSYRLLNEGKTYYEAARKDAGGFSSK